MAAEIVGWILGWALWGSGSRFFFSFILYQETKLFWMFLVGMGKCPQSNSSKRKKHTP